MVRLFTAFSGYDSQCMALDRAGIDYELVGWSEIDKYAIAAHNAVYPQYAECNYGDISRIDWAQVPDFDLFTYSSPCQDFSTAGLQRGGTKGSGTRSSLLWECEQAIAAKRPKYLLFENVAALVSQKFIRLFNEWQLLLERMGYTNFTQVLNAKDYGVPKNRERVFMVSILDCDKPFYFPNPKPITKCLRDVLEKNVDDRYYLTENGIKQIFKNCGRRGEFKGGVGVQDGSKPANTLIATHGKLQRQATYIRERFYRQAVGTAVADNAAVGDTIDAFNRRTNKSGIAPTVTTRPDGFKTAILPIDDHNRIRKLTPKECFRLMGVSDDYADKMIATLSRTQCYKLAGNSIVVDVLAAIFEQKFVCNKNKNQQTEIFN